MENLIISILKTHLPSLFKFHVGRSVPLPGKKFPIIWIFNQKFRVMNPGGVHTRKVMSGIYKICVKMPGRLSCSFLGMISAPSWQ